MTSKQHHRIDLAYKIGIFFAVAAIISISITILQSLGVIPGF